LEAGERTPELKHFSEWIDRGYAGEMEYLKRKDEQGNLLRSSLRGAFPWVRSVIVCAANYQASGPRSIDPAPEGSGWIARYAWSGRAGSAGDEPQMPTDYHKVLLERLRRLELDLKTEIGDFSSRCFVDTGPLVERVYAKYAGLGWQGKNTCLINQGAGSWLFLSVILTDIDVAGGAKLQIAPDRCGTCTRCIDACPTNALIEPYKMDASLCLSYFTIEKRGSIPTEIRPQLGLRLRHLPGRLSMESPGAD
jgi:epoxyqueuosine reductase